MTHWHLADIAAKPPDVCLMASLAYREKVVRASLERAYRVAARSNPGSRIGQGKSGVSSGVFSRLFHRPRILQWQKINKLSVGQALDKLRRPDLQSKQTRIDEKMGALDEDMQRMRATRRRLERAQRAAETTASDA